MDTIERFIFGLCYYVTLTWFSASMLGRLGLDSMHWSVYFTLGNVILFSAIGLFGDT